MRIFAQLQRLSALFRRLDSRRSNPGGTPGTVRRRNPQRTGDSFARLIVRMRRGTRVDLARPRAAQDTEDNPSRFKREGCRADQNFTDFDSRLAAVRAVIIRASLG